MPSSRPVILNAHSRAADPRQAVKEFHARVWQPEMELVVFFCSSQYDLGALAEEMNRQFAGTRVVGCTTAGEIGASGYVTHSLTGASFPSGMCTAVTGLLDSLHNFELLAGQTFAQSLLQQLEQRAPEADESNSFAFLLIDGLSTREEAVTRIFQDSIGCLPLVGGSAGDDQKFAQTSIFHNGAFHSDAAALILLSTAYQFKIFKSQHFISDTERLVVTKADAARRVVQEINGLPAAQEYARIIGVPVSDLTAASFASSPVVVLINGTNYVRSIQKVNGDGSLTFYCAIDEGLVFRVAHGENLVDNLAQTFNALQQDVGPPQAVFACDCILRDVETIQSGQKEAVAELFRRNNAVGFSTYGEQFCGTHVNQTLTGIAFGTAVRPPGKARAPNPGLDENLRGARPGTSPQFVPHQAGRTDLGDEDALRDEITRLNKMISALINHAERTMGAQGSDFGMFQTAILLENQVRTRTRELEEARVENERINRDLQRANRELEAFSYSVAHDLKAPLRSIDGFSRMLEKGWAERLDEEGRRHLRQVRDGAQRMAQIIEDLLHLSQCSRADLREAEMDLADVARRIVADLRLGQPDRRVEFAAPKHLPAYGDLRLLTVALENLLGNAWKYSSRRPIAHIELGYDPRPSAYFVRDNGAGFDMAYADKLFKVGQRLHSVSEFEGTGIGLAIVQRIIERHGGRVWAEAKVDEGTTVYFTLPPAPQ